MYSRGKKTLDIGRFDTYYHIAYGLAFLVAVYSYFIRRYFSSDQYEQLALYSLYFSGIVFVWGAVIRWTWDKLFSLAAVALFIYLIPRENYLTYSTTDFSILSFFLLSGAVDPRQSKLMDMIFYGKMFLAIGVLAFYVAGKIPDLTVLRSGKELVRHSYGFMHPNSLSMFMVSLFYDFSLMSKKSMRRADILWVILLGLFTYAATHSRTGFIIFIVIVIASFFKDLLSKWTLPGWVVFSGIVGIFTMGTYISVFYKENSPTYNFLNTIFTRRPLNGHTYIEAYGFSTLPREIPALHYDNGQVMYNDSFYVDALLRQGLFAYLLFPITIGIQMFTKRYSLYHSILLLLTFATALMEQYGASICICSILLVNYFGQSKKVKHDLD